MKLRLLRNCEKIIMNKNKIDEIVVYLAPFLPLRQRSRSHNLFCCAMQLKFKNPTIFSENFEMNKFIKKFEFFFKKCDFSNRNFFKAKPF